jgi:C4-dicarboxylate transporter DctM subunit
MITPTPMFGLIELLVLVTLSVLGVPIAVAMGVTGLVFASIYYGGITGGANLAALTAWSNSTSFTMTMIPLYILMGELVSEHGLGKDAFDSFYRWLYKIRGSLAFVSIVACGFFGGVTGSSAADVVAIGSVSVPEMRRYGYSRGLRLGLIAAAGTLGILIPPSIIMIFYGMITNTSIGKLYIAALIPGILLVVIYSLVVVAWSIIYPKSFPTVPKEELFTFKEKWVSLKGPIPIFLIFIFIMGGIYTGVFSPTEAAGVGAVIAFASVLILRRVNWKGFFHACHNSVKLTAMIMFLIMGAMLLAHTIAITKFPALLETMVMKAGYSSISVIFGIIVIEMLLGCVLDTFGLLVLTVPLFLPILTKLGYDPIWFGVLMTVLVELALITPPVAANLYIAQSLESDAKAMDVIKGVWPFFFADVGLVVLMVFFPQICLFLPSRM